MRNAVMMAARAHFSQKQVYGIAVNQLQEKLWAEKGVNFNDYLDGAKRGRVCVKQGREEEITYVDRRDGEAVTTEAFREPWTVTAAPHFVAEPGGWLADMIPAQRTFNDDDLHSKPCDGS